MPLKGDGLQVLGPHHRACARPTRLPTPVADTGKPDQGLARRDLWPRLWRRSSPRSDAYLRCRLLGRQANKRRSIQHSHRVILDMEESGPRRPTLDHQGVEWHPGKLFRHGPRRKGIAHKPCERRLTRHRHLRRPRHPRPKKRAAGEDEWVPEGRGGRRPASSACRAARPPAPPHL